VAGLEDVSPVGRCDPDAVVFDVETVGEAADPDRDRRRGSNGFDGEPVILAFEGEDDRSEREWSGTLPGTTTADGRGLG